MTSTRPPAQRLDAVVRQRILTAKLRPGDLVLEPELAAEFGVSRTPAREALRLLAAEGWLRAVPRRGYVVRDIRPDDVHEVMDLRYVLEPMLAAAAARVATPEVVAHLRDLVAGQRDAGAHLEAALDCAWQFHLDLAAASGNRRAQLVIEPLIREIIRMHHLLPSVGSHVHSSAEYAAHAAIVDALEAGDPDRAADRMREHLAEARAAMVAAI